MVEKKTAKLSENQEIRDLQFRLFDLAAEFALCDLSRDIEIQDEYAKIVDQMYELGWDGLIDFTAELPPRYMPRSYAERNPDAVAPIKNSDWTFPGSPYKNMDVDTLLAELAKENKNDD